MRLAMLNTDGGAVPALGTDERHLLRLDRWLPGAGEDPVSLLTVGREALEAGLQPAYALLADPSQRDALLTSGDLVPIDEADFAVPVTRPSKVVCLALNYHAHAEEGGFSAPTRPVIFLKGPNSLCGHGDTVVVPPASRRLDHEGELAVVIGRRCRALTEDNWMSAVAGYTIINDLTARDLQLEDIESNHPWDFTKSFDTYGPMGPWLVTPEEIPDPQRLDLVVRVDGEVRQSGSTSAMIFGVRDLLVYISSVMTLEPADVIATGTCDGIGPIPDGSTVEVEISGLGVLRNPVRFASAGS